MKSLPYLHGVEVLSPSELKKLVGDSTTHLSGPGKSVYDIVTGKILDYMDKNKELPWQKPWKGARNMLPANFVSKKPYRGINSILLNIAPGTNPYYLTAKQVSDLKGNIKKGAQSHLVVFYAKSLSKTVKEKDPDTGESKKKTITQELDIPVLRYYLVFNGEDIEGIDWKLPVPEELTEAEQIESCEDILAAMPNKPSIKEVPGDDAYYRPSTDSVVVPTRQQFEKIQQFYSTLFHELVHSTKHEKRLGSRGLEAGKKFGDKGYTKEELVAELGASFLCSQAGILFATLHNTAAYLKGWNTKLVQVFKEDSKFIVVAAGLGQRAADYIQGKLNSEKKSTSTEEKTPSASGDQLLMLAKAKAQARIRILSLSDQPARQKIAGLSGIKSSGDKEVFEDLPEDIEAKYEWLKAKYPSALLLFKLKQKKGEIYRAFYAQDTGVVKKTLGINPTISKNGLLQSDIKASVIDEVTRKLVKAGYRVALIEELPVSALDKAIEMGRKRISNFKKQD